ncbi:hypothetical protein [Natrialba taiwanensis]|uniref:Na+/H+ antiporter n=1 Tax=Natrialba taiwanensis DSM 12281 TaxID=1230458 RepID=M0ABY1_9EURY|nr:hypothetical protein [Natrialba taiwanensis]ELY95901.1 Na+/H+ antiporter [Natrialba taiwanensis DSM 12281]
MLAPFAAVLSFIVVLAGVLCLYEFFLYDADEKAAAPVRSRIYLGSVLLLVLLGVGGLVAIATNAVSQMTVLGLIGIFGALPAFAQYLFHRQIDAETGPLARRVSDRWS